MDMAITGLLMNMFPFIKRLLFYLSSFADHSCSVGDNFITRFQAVCNNVFFSIIYWSYFDQSRHGFSVYNLVD